MLFYSIHVIAEYDLSGSGIICRQIIVIGKVTHNLGCLAVNKKDRQEAEE